MTHIITLYLLAMLPHSCVQMPSGVVATYPSGGGYIVYNMNCDEFEFMLEGLL